MDVLENLDLPCAEVSRVAGLMTANVLPSEASTSWAPLDPGQHLQADFRAHLSVDEHARPDKGGRVRHRAGLFEGLRTVSA